MFLGGFDKTAFIGIGSKGGIIGLGAGAVAGGVAAHYKTKLSPDKKHFASKADSRKAHLLIGSGAGLGSLAGHFAQHKTLMNLRSQ